MLRLFMEREDRRLAWDTVCKPKEEDGMGLGKLEDINDALASTYGNTYNKIVCGQNVFRINIVLFF